MKKNCKECIFCHPLKTRCTYYREDLNSKADFEQEETCKQYDKKDY